MSGEHVHRWKQVAKTYAPPVRPLVGGSIAANIVEKMMFGVTTILWECEDGRCSETRKEEMLGAELDKENR